MQRPQTAPDKPQRGPAPLFLLSFRQRDELAALAGKAGWQVIAARRGADAERRFVASGASVAVVDARGAFADGLTAAQDLAGRVEEMRAALLVLVSKADVGRIGEAFAAGATHFLASPFSEAEFLQSLRFAARHADRAGAMPGEAAGGETLGWRYDPRLGTLQLTPDLARLSGLGEAPAPRAVMRGLKGADRRGAFAALRRVKEEGASTAFAHEVQGMGRVVQHLQRATDSGQLHGLIERLGAPDSVSAVRDALTGVRDAASAKRWLGRKLGEGKAVSAVRVALDGFEQLNADHGRAAGDALLRAVSRRIEEAARVTLGARAIAARMGGAEFLAAAEAVDATVLKAAAGAIGEALARPFAVGEGFASVRASLVTGVSSADESAEALLRRLADAARPDAVEDVPLDRLAMDLPGALERGEIEMLFQPQVAIGSGEITGVEALARWRHPELGEIGAEALFAAAERAKLAVPLSDHAQREALTAASRWPRVLDGLRLSINVTAADIARGSFADILLDRVDSSRFPRSRLTIEITENGLIDDLGRAAGLFAELRAAGLRVAIDDFGTGYSSLAYLKALPLDYLKIDKKLSQDIAGTARDRIVVRGVIDMARSLGLSVIAEGVETAEQLELLAREGCQYYQGFLCAEPVTTEALVKLLEAAK